MKNIIRSAILMILALWLRDAKADPLCSGITGYIPYQVVGNARAIQPVPLTEGHWDCSVAMDLQADKTTSVSAVELSLSQTANQIGDFPWTTTSGPNGGPGYGMSVSLPVIRIDVTAPTIYYINALVYFTNGTLRVRSAFHCTNITISY